MIRVILALCLVTIPAAAQDANARAEKEAATFLRSCDLVSTIFREYCRPDQKQFVDSYVMAKSGQTYFMGDVAGHLDPSNLNLQLGIVIDRYEACAWRMVRAEIEATLDHGTGAIYMAALSEHCAGLSAPGKVTVIQRATAILRDLKTAPTKPLPWLSGYPVTPPLPAKKP